MTDLPAECRKHSDELPLPYEVKVTLLDAAARIEQLEAALQWRPIEEAPKDGRHILLRIGNLVGSGRFGHPHAWGITDNDGFYLDGADLPSGATHWMPLPPPPAGETNE